jgi:aryl-alcohol dehydrogenase-like predicted oxidoreductase
VHTKFVPDLALLPSLSRADVEAIIDRSRARLGMERLDLVQFHWWDYAQPRCVEALLHLKDLALAGKIAHIAGTNFDAAHLAEFDAAGAPLTSIQVQYSLLDRRPAGAFTATAAASHTGLICYGALAGVFLYASWLGAQDPAETLTNRSLIKYRLIIDECGGWDAFQALLSVLDRIAQRHAVPLSAVAARWCFCSNSAIASFSLRALARVRRGHQSKRRSSSKIAPRIFVYAYPAKVRPSCGT